jgi:hypothetical protein
MLLLLLLAQLTLDVRLPTASKISARLSQVARRFRPTV